MTLLRQRMLEELQRHNYSQETIESHISSVKEFAEYFHKSPDLLGAEEVRRYQLHLINFKKLAAQTVKVRMSALRFFYLKSHSMENANRWPIRKWLLHFCYSNYVQTRKNHRFRKYQNPQRIHRGMLFPLSIGFVSAIRIAKHRFLSPHRR